MEIRTAVLEDAQAIHDLHTISVRTLCSQSYPPEIIEGWLKGRTPEGYRGIEKKEMYVLEEDGQIVGFSHVVPGEIVALFVHPDFTRKGFGTRLLEHAKDLAKQNWTGPIRVDSTLNAEPFYKSCGFSKVGEAWVKRNDVNIPIVNMQC